MSQENVEVVRSFLDASSLGDTESLMAALDPAIEWTPVIEDPDYRVHRGLEDVAAWLAEWSEIFPDMRWEAERILDAGDDASWRAVVPSGAGVRRALMWDRRPTPSSSRSGRARSCGSMSPTPRPSKPWGWRSRRLGGASGC